MQGLGRVKVVEGLGISAFACISGGPWVVPNDWALKEGKYR